VCTSFKHWIFYARVVLYDFSNLYKITYLACLCLLFSYFLDGNTFDQGQCNYNISSSFMKTTGLSDVLSTASQGHVIITKYFNLHTLIKGVIRRIILFDKVLAKAEKSCLTPLKFKSDC
jgi:hypothetical protein